MSTLADANKILADTTAVEDELLDELDDLDEPAHIREKRLQELQARMNALQEMKQKQFGELTPVQKEKEILEITTSVPRCIVLFHHPDFKKSLLVEDHLRSIARKYFSVKFVAIDVRGCGFLVDKLKLKVMPVVVCFKDGITIDRIEGFDGIRGAVDSCSKEEYEGRLQKSPIFADQKIADKSIFGFSKRDDDDSDLDD
eukprot:Clim_evm71s134 gene=Clim_evmTU71s134